MRSALRMSFAIGIDVNRSRISKASIKSDRSEAENLWFLCAEGMEFLKFLPRHVKIEKIWVLYPDPWPKKRHFKNRIVQEAFLETLAEVSLSSAKLYVKSDQACFIEWTEELILLSDKWQLCRAQTWPEVATTVFQALTRGKSYEVTAKLV